MSATGPAAGCGTLQGCEIGHHPAADQPNPGQRQTHLEGQRACAVHPDRRPAEPGPDVAGCFQPDPARPDADGRGVELGYALSAPDQQFSGAPEDPPRVSAEADVAVDQQDRLPSAHSGQWLEHVTEEGGRAAAAGQPDRRRGAVDAERGYAPPNESRDQPARPAPQFDRGSEAHLRDGFVEDLVDVVIGCGRSLWRTSNAQPAAGGQHADLAVLVPNPTSLAAQRPVVELAQHLTPLASCPTGRSGRG